MGSYPQELEDKEKLGRNRWYMLESFGSLPLAIIVVQAMKMIVGDLGKSSAA